MQIKYMKERKRFMELRTAVSPKVLYYTTAAGGISDSGAVHAG